MKNITPKEKTILRFKDRLSKNKSIKYKDIKSDDPTLLYAIERYYGGILKISEKLNISEDELIEKYGLSRNLKKQTLSKEEIHDRLLYLKSLGRLSTSAMRTDFNDFRLETSIKKIFGNVKAAYEYYNLTRDTIKHTKKSIIESVYKLNKEIDDMSYAKAITANSTLVHSATNVLKKGWHDILDDLNIDYKSKYKRLNKKNILHRLKSLYEQEKRINYSLIQKYDSSILFYAYENYDNIVDFYVDMGLNPNECIDFSLQTTKGFQFEQVFKKILDLMQVEYKFNQPYKKGIRPDFRLNKGTWIDCKLSAWTNSIEDTVERYAPECDKLIIVFLRGEYRHLPAIENDKVEFRKIDYYYPFLKQIQRQDLIEDLENIQNNDFYLSVTTERLIS